MPDLYELVLLEVVCIYIITKVYYELVEYTYTFVHELVLASMHARQSAT